ncbi:MAG: hypothetical protein AAF585_11645 [Verrucomicrobiota bacterium]
MSRRKRRIVSLLCTTPFVAAACLILLSPPDEYYSDPTKIRASTDKWDEVLELKVSGRAVPPELKRTTDSNELEFENGVVIRLKAVGIFWPSKNTHEPTPSGRGKIRLFHPFTGEKIADEESQKLLAPFNRGTFDFWDFKPFMQMVFESNSKEPITWISSDVFNSHTHRHLAAGGSTSLTDNASLHKKRFDAWHNPALTIALDFQSPSNPSARAVFDIPSLPGSPNNSEQLTNLFDARVPYVRFEDTWEMRDFISCSTELIDYLPSHGEKVSSVWKDATVAEITDDLAERLGIEIQVDGKTDGFYERQSWIADFENWFRGFLR